MKRYMIISAQVEKLTKRTHYTWKIDLGCARSHQHPNRRRQVTWGLMIMTKKMVG